MRCASKTETDKPILKILEIIEIFFFEDMWKWQDLNLSTSRNNNFCVSLLKLGYKI